MLKSLALLGLLLSGTLHANCGQLPDYQARLLHSKDTLSLCPTVTGKVALIVNTASRCGFTPQFAGLESLYQEYRDDGLVVIGFPSDDFNQEFADEEKTASVCYINYGVSFPMMASSAVTGTGANPVFKALARETEAPRWNFHKYLVDRDGNVVAAFPAAEKPRGGDLETRLQALLATPAR